MRNLSSPTLRACASSQSEMATSQGPGVLGSAGKVMNTVPLTPDRSKSRCEVQYQPFTLVQLMLDMMRLASAGADQSQSDAK